jgi:hypothetical protein
MVLGNLAAPQNVNLWLSVDGWSIGETIYRDSLVRVKDWVGAVGKASRLFVWVKAIEQQIISRRENVICVQDIPGSQTVLLLRCQHLRLLFEYKQLVTVEGVGDEIEIG